MDNNSCQGQNFCQKHNLYTLGNVDASVEKLKKRLCTEHLPKCKKKSYTVSIDRIQKIMDLGWSSVK